MPAGLSPWHQVYKRPHLLLGDACFARVSSQGATEMAIEFETLKLPYYRALPLGLDPESWMLLQGFVPQQSRGFNVDFTYGQFRGASIPFRFKLSFEGPPSSSSAIIALNTFTEGQWGKEKRVPAHIRQGQRFKVQFIVTSKGYKIMENDKFLCDFDHRLSPKRIRFLEMDGDIVLENIAFNWESSSRSSRFL